MFLLSFIESAYLIFMFRYFETDVDFNFLPQIDILKESEWFGHLHGSRRGLRICPFGQEAIVYYVAFLLLRNLICVKPIFNIIALVISFVLSLLNFNATVYLLPIWMIELSLLYGFKSM
jgi:hypothetical protein